MAADIAALDDILGLHIRLAHGAVLRHFSEHFADLGLTQKQVSVLWLAHDHPGIAQTDLARQLQMDRATTMSIVHALERKNLLERQTPGEDRRRIGLRLSADGQALLARARTAIADHEQWLRARFTAVELEQFVQLLKRVHGG